MELAMLETMEEHDHVLSLLKNSTIKDKIYIGGTKLESKYWYWAESERPIDYSFKWLPGEPNNIGGKEECLDLFKGYGNDIGFNDESCEYKRQQILCEKF
jgi:hypothetical protein